MKAVFITIFSIISISAVLQPCHAEHTSEEEIVGILMDYISKDDAYSIDWPASMAETGRLLRNKNQERGPFLAFVLRGHVNTAGFRLAALTHHEALNKRIGAADYEFIWAAPMVLPDKQTKSIILVRPRKTNP